MVIVETHLFTKLIQELMSDEQYKELQKALVVQPDMGALIKGSGGLRKVRWKLEARRHKEKWRCTRHLLLGNGRRPYPHALRIPERQARKPDTESNQATKNAGRAVVTMDNKMFDELMASVQEMDGIIKGQKNLLAALSSPILK